MSVFRGAPAATLTAAALVLTAGVVVTPAGAITPANPPVVVENCSKTLAGVPLRIKLRFELRDFDDANDVRLARVRVSHPDGRGNFAERRVLSTATTLMFESETTNPQLGSAVWAERKADKPAFRKRLGDTHTFRVVTTFKLRNGQRATLACSHQFPGN
jgi:hypothetical protein